MAKPKHQILSMGWGVQTWTLAAMAALDEIERPDFIVFADTTHESQKTYDFIAQWEPWLDKYGLEVKTIKGERTNVVREDWSNSTLIPAYTVDSTTRAYGQIKRECTHEWKIMPIRRFIRAELRRLQAPLQPGLVQLWLGISWDEAPMRMRDSDVAYIIHRYPLVEKRLTRLHCISWLQEHELPVPPKSACVFCPYSSLSRWKELKRKGGDDWKKAVAVDLTIRDKRPKYSPLFLHPSRRPLEEAVSIPEDNGASQMRLEDVSCDSGFCFS